MGSLRTSDRCHWCGNPHQVSGNLGGFPRQCAHWLGMTLFRYVFASLRNQSADWLWQSVLPAMHSIARRRRNLKLFAKLKFSESISKKQKRDTSNDVSLFWWGMVDSNHRRHSQQIYSLSPLATREIPHIHLARMKPVDGLVS